MIRTILFFVCFVGMSVSVNAQEASKTSAAVKNTEVKPVNNSTALPAEKTAPALSDEEKKAQEQKKLEEEKKKLPRDAITGKRVEPKKPAGKKETLRDNVRKKIKDKKNPAN